MPSTEADEEIKVQVEAPLPALIVEPTADSLPGKSPQAPQVFTRRQLLVFSGARPFGRCSLRLPVSESEAGSVILADADRPCSYCVDSRGAPWLDVAAVERKLRGRPAEVALHLYCDPAQSELLQARRALGLAGHAAEAKRPEEVLMLADFFQGAAARTWVTFYDDEQSAEMASVVPLPQRGSPLPGTLEASPTTLGAGALRMDPTYGRLALRRAFRQGGLCDPCGCLCLRSRFYDSLGEEPSSQNSSHWIGLASSRGSCAVGIAPGMEQCYSFLNGCCPDGAPGQYFGWQRSTLGRSAGWHAFEILIQEGRSILVIIDGEAVFRGLVEGAGQPAEEGHAWLVAKRGAPGLWTALEMIHAPPGCTAAGGPGLGSQGADSPSRCPWQLRSEECGLWQVDANGAVWRLGDECTDAPEERPAVVEDSAAVSEKPAPEPAQDVSPGSQLSITCWSLQPTDLERIDQLMKSFLERLREAGVVLPENVERVGQCEDVQHQGCLIYNFGTRRLHIATREGKDGRLMLVVRCGGGFLDFADFARRHGSAEHLKFKRQADGQLGTQVIRLVSIRANKELRLQEVSHAGSKCCPGGGAVSPHGSAVSRPGSSCSPGHGSSQRRSRAATPPPQSSQSPAAVRPVPRPLRASSATPPTVARRSPLALPQILPRLGAMPS